MRMSNHPYDGLVPLRCHACLAHGLERHAQPNDMALAQGIDPVPGGLGVRCLRGSMIAMTAKMTAKPANNLGRPRTIMDCRR